MPERSLAYIETPYLSVTSVVADAVSKAGHVRILGFEPTGAETIVIRLAAAAISDLHAALETAKEVAVSLGVKALTATIARPDEAQFHLNDHPNSINPLYGGRDELRPTDFPENRTMKLIAVCLVLLAGVYFFLQVAALPGRAANLLLTPSCAPMGVLSSGTTLL